MRKFEKDRQTTVNAELDPFGRDSNGLTQVYMVITLIWLVISISIMRGERTGGNEQFYWYSSHKYLSVFCVWDSGTKSREMISKKWTGCAFCVLVPVSLMPR